ncbi:MAG TPA: hypothetical protein DEP28_12650 [Bacteroidetes bacterium]|nr:hypothetical protein [Bacteroidota bacterium]HCN36297.1 hypothetical protein [Bacteroidota bacterium]
MTPVYIQRIKDFVEGDENLLKEIIKGVNDALDEIDKFSSSEYNELNAESFRTIHHKFKPTFDIFGLTEIKTIFEENKKILDDPPVNFELFNQNLKTCREITKKIKTDLEKEFQ